MGWLISHDLTKEQQVAELVAGWEKEGKGTKCLGHSVRGNVLYAVMQPFVTGEEPDEATRWISVCLLRKDRGSGWGYKDMSESMAPYQYNCPMKFLKMTLTVASETWREGVIALRNKRRSFASVALEAGTRVRFKEGCTVLGEALTEGVITRKQGRGYMVQVGHSEAKIFKRHIAEIIKVSD